MRAGITVKVTPDDRRRLEAIVSDRNAPQKHVWRAKIILATADGCGTSEIMRRSGKAKPVVWRWQARFMAEGVEGLTRDKTRKPGKPPLPAATVQRVVDLALSAPPGEASHWTGRMLVKAAGVSLRSVQRILEAHQLAPHRIRTFKLSNDPKFAEKLKDIVGLYVDPPAHAVVLSVDEKSQNGFPPDLRISQNARTIANLRSSPQFICGGESDDRHPSCCARTPSGHTTVAPPRSVMNSRRVESRTGAVAWAMWQHSVSRPRSSNRTCRFPASGFPTSFIVRPTAVAEAARVEAVEHRAPRKP